MSITLTTVILFAVFGVLLFLGVPISISIVVSSIVTAMSTLTALRSTRESADGKRLYNPSAQPIWFVADGKVRVAEPGKLCEI